MLIVYLYENKFTYYSYIIFCLGATAQKISKKPLDYSVFDGWQSLVNERLSNKGNGWIKVFWL